MKNSITLGLLMNKLNEKVVKETKVNRELLVLSKSCKELREEINKITTEMGKV
jgi:hypothetical protein